MRYLVSLAAFVAAISWLGCSQILYTWPTAPVMHFVSWGLFLAFAVIASLALSEWPRLVTFYRSIL